MAIVVHGYFLDPNYAIPPLIASIVGSGVTGAAALLGFHVGVIGATQAAGTVAKAMNDNATAPPIQPTTGVHAG